MPDIAVVRAAANTGTGTQDFTSSGFGTPKGALFMLSYGTADGTAVSHAMLSVGFTDGTRHRGLAVWTENGVVNNSDTGSNESDTAPVITLLNTDGSISGSADFSAWITDGVRINWTDAPPAAYRITCVLFGGSGVSNCYVNNWTSPSVVDTAQDFNTVGFLPDLIISWSALNAFDNTFTSTARPSFGFAVRDGSDTQRCVAWHTPDASNPTQCVAVADSNCIARSAGSGAGGGEVQVGDFDTSGVSFYQRNTTTSQQGIFIALKFNGLTAKAVTVTTPTANGSSSITGIGFTPQFGMLGFTATQTLNTVATNNDADVFGLSAFDATTAGCIAVASVDASATSSVENITDAKPVRLRKAGADFMTATFTTFTTDGVTLNYTLADATVRQCIGLFISATGGIAKLLSGKLEGKLGRD